jgi:PmbA protein
VEEITIAGNLKEMFQGMIAIGNDIEDRGFIHCGSILIDKMTVGGH